MEVFDDSKSYKVLKLLLQPLGDLFFPYLTNRDLGKLDSAISDTALRKFYFKEAGTFYSINFIESIDEFAWIIKRRIPLSRLTLSLFDFELQGMACCSISHPR